MQMGLVFALLAAAGVGFALLLQTAAGHWLEQEYMWAVVVIGVSIVLAGLLLLVSWDTVQLIFWAFATVGIPIIIRAFVNKRNADKAVVKGLRE